MFDPSRSPDELQPDQLIGETDGGALPVVASGDLRDELQETLEAHARIFRKAAGSDLRKLAIDPELSTLFGDDLDDGVIPELDDDELFVKARSRSGPARDRYIAALSRFIKDSGRPVDEIVEYAIDSGDDYLAEDLRAAAELIAA